MLRKTFFAILIALVSSSYAVAQTDSTDLDVYMSEGVLVTPLDSMLYAGEEFEQLNVDFTISDTMLFSKVHIKLINIATNSPMYIGAFDRAQLEEISAFDNWAVTFPFGMVSNLEGYIVHVTIEQLGGALGEEIIKTHLP